MNWKASSELIHDNPELKKPNVSNTTHELQILKKSSSREVCDNIMGEIWSTVDYSPEKYLK